MRNAAIIAALLAGTAHAADVPCSDVPREACENDIDLCLWKDNQCIALFTGESNDCNQIDGHEDQCNKNDFCNYHRADKKCNNRDEKCGLFLSASDCDADAACFWNRDITGWEVTENDEYVPWVRTGPTGKAHCLTLDACGQMSALSSVCNDHPSCYFDKAWETCRGIDDVFEPDNVGGIGWYAGDPCTIKEKKACNEDSMCDYDGDAWKTAKCTSRPVRERIEAVDGSMTDAKLAEKVKTMECGELYNQKDCRFARNAGHTCKWNTCNVKGVGYAYCQDTTADTAAEFYPSNQCKAQGGGEPYDTMYCQNAARAGANANVLYTHSMLSPTNDYRKDCQLFLAGSNTAILANTAAPDFKTTTSQIYVLGMTKVEEWYRVQKHEGRQAALEWCYHECVERAKSYEVVASMDDWHSFQDGVTDDATCYCSPAATRGQRLRKDEGRDKGAVIGANDLAYYGHYDCGSDEAMTSMVNDFDIHEMKSCRYDQEPTPLTNQKF